MKYQPTQVYLDPEDHARLKAEAQRRGISLAALIRELVSAHVGERAPAYGAKSWEGFIGAADSGVETDIANEFDRYAAEVADDLYEKKMGLAPRTKKAPRKRGRT